MKKRIVRGIYLFIIIIITSSCTDYLSILPKGKKVPVTFNDYEALLRYEYFDMTCDVTLANILLCDQYFSPSYFTWYPIYKILYYWDENEDRTPLTKTSNTFTYLYKTISNCNLILDNTNSITDCTDAQRKELAAYATVIRAHCYFVLTNFYAEAYNSSTSSAKLSVPLVTTSKLNVEYTQPSLKDMYMFLTSSVESIVEDLPKEGITILHPCRGAGYAFLARTYMQMMNYDKALEYSNKALDENARLYDWNNFYQKYKAEIDNPATYVTNPSPLGHDCCENYFFKPGQIYYATTDNSIPIWRAGQFEDDDVRFLSRWKKYTVGTTTYYRAITTGFYNYGGLSTPEQYLIKAECLARQNNISEAMNTLNALRKSRLLTNKYHDMVASNTAEAIDKILSAKHNEMGMTIMNLADLKRINSEGTYANQIIREENNTTYTLSVNSHLLTFPFPLNDFANQGAGSFVQNVTK